MSQKPPNPCIGVCKFKRAGHCVGCSMTKAQKALYKSLKKNGHKAAFIQMLQAQQEQLGKFDHWNTIYDRKCRKKGASCRVPLSDAA